MATQLSSIQLIYRKPKPEDGAQMWELVRDSKQLDLNSAYSYLMIAKYFTDTCVIAEDNGSVVGFISGYRIPGQYNHLFIWQVVVSEHYRGKGIGIEMIHALLEQMDSKTVHYIETTISPSNQASLALFAKATRELESVYEVLEGFPMQLFPVMNHELEMLYRIGPIALKNKN